MSRTTFLALSAALALGACVSGGASSSGSLEDDYCATVDRIWTAARAESRAYAKLEHLCDRIGPRLSGSAALEKAARWAADALRADGIDARLEPVTVPVWVRGRERAAMTAPREAPLAMLGLGNSVGTPPGGVEAEVVAVRDFEHLEALGEAVRGKLVLYTAKMPPYDEARGSGYGETVRYRVDGPSRAAAAGAVGALVRSVTARSLRTPHTGMLRYDPKLPRIPAAAVATEDADLLERLCAAGETVRVRLEMEARFDADALSANVVGELRGATHPHEVVVIGGHLDSWDVGQGAQDDGAACCALLEAMRLLRSLGLRPRRTIRVVLFTNEENGLAGAKAYEEAHRAEMADHVAALEADGGIFRPQGVTSPEAKDAQGERVNARLAEVLALLAPYGAGRRKDGGGGADIAPMAAHGVPQIGFDVEGSTYFDFHHTDADTLDKVARRDLDDCVAALASLAFVLADMPERLRD